MGPHAVGSHEEIEALLVISALALQAVKMATWTVAILGFVMGSALLTAPAHFFEPDSRVRRLFFDANLVSIFNRRYVVERRVYRWHRAVGVLVMIGSLAALLLLVLVTGESMSAGARALLGLVGFRLAIGLMAAVVLALFAISFVLIVRPSALKALEAAANRWIALERPRSSRRFDLPGLVLRFPRVTGLLFLVAALFSVWSY